MAATTITTPAAEPTVVDPTTAAAAVAAAPTTTPEAAWNQEKIKLQGCINELTKEKQTLEDKIIILNAEVEQLKNTLRHVPIKDLPLLLKEEEIKNSVQLKLEAYEHLKNGNQESEQMVSNWDQEIQSIMNEYHEFEMKSEPDIVGNGDKNVDSLRNKELLYQKMIQIPKKSQLVFENLNKQYRIIQSQSKQLGVKVDEMSKTFATTQTDYNKQVQETTEIQKACIEMLHKCAQMIQMQNQMLNSKVEQQNQLKNVEQERAYVQELEQKCKQLLDSSDKLHQKFKEDLQKLRNILDQRYSDLEKVWFKWSPVTIAFFTQKYLSWWSLPDKLEVLKKMQTTMSEKEIDGNNIHQVGKDVLVNVLGLSMPCAIKMEEFFQNLNKKYPRGPDTKQIPDKFICPMSGNVMEEPVDVYTSEDAVKDLVFVSDRITCDRSSIKKYLDEHPELKLTYEQLRIFDNMALVLEIQEFFQNHPELKNLKGVSTLIEGEEAEGKEGS